jgi:hypothetical protein
MMNDVRQGRLVSNISPGQSSALRPISIQTLTEIKFIISIEVTVCSAVLCMGTMDSCPVVTQANEPHANLCMLYMA